MRISTALDESFRIIRLTSSDRVKSTPPARFTLDLLVPDLRSPAIFLSFFLSLSLSPNLSLSLNLSIYLSVSLNYAYQ